MTGAPGEPLADLGLTSFWCGTPRPIIKIPKWCNAHIVSVLPGQKKGYIGSSPLACIICEQLRFVIAFNDFIFRNSGVWHSIAILSHIVSYLLWPYGKLSSYVGKEKFSRLTTQFRMVSYTLPISTVHGVKCKITLFKSDLVAKLICSANCKKLLVLSVW